MSLKGSKTEDNLKEAFAGESQANRRYLYFAAKADVEGYNDVAAGAFQQNLHFLLCILERRLAAAGQLDPVLEFFHRLVERQVAAFKFLDNGFEIREGFLQVEVLFRRHRRYATTRRQSGQRAVVALTGGAFGNRVSSLSRLGLNENHTH